MIKRTRGLIVEVTEGDTVFGGGGNAVSDVVKSALKSFAARMAGELRTHHIAAVSITPGFLRSETMLQHFGVTEDNWRDGGKKDKNFLQSESPLFVGRAVAALAADPKVLDRSGDILSSWELARQYGFTDCEWHGGPTGARTSGRFSNRLASSSRSGSTRDFLDRMRERMGQYLAAADADGRRRPDHQPHHSPRPSKEVAAAPERPAATRPSCYRCRWR